MSLTTWEEYAKGRETERVTAYNSLLDVYMQKLERIKWNYSRDLNEKQFAANRKDEELLGAVESCVNILMAQIEFLEKQNNGLNVNLYQEIDYRAKIEFELLIAKHKLLTQKTKKQPI